MYSIKEAAQMLGVEAHALRFWEEELALPIRRNPQGRRIYDEADMQRFREVLSWKEQGLALKEIKTLLHGETDDMPVAGQRIIVYHPADTAVEKEEKARRFQELLKQFISESIKESNAELLETVKEGIMKELDYQFRLQEEREIEREDAHFKNLDEHIRTVMEKRGKKKKKFFRK